VCACGGGRPSITTQPQDVTVLVGSTATFSAAASGDGLSWTWLRDGAAIPGANAASYTTPALDVSDDQASFAVTVKNGLGSETSAPATLRVDYVQIDTQPLDQGVAEGQSVTFTVGASGNGALFYQWRKGTSDIPRAISASYTLPVALALDVGEYSCEVKSILNGVTATVVSQPAKLAVVVPPAIQTNPSSLTVKEQDPATFTVVATGSGTLSYQWQKDGNDLPGETALTLAIAAASASDQGSYRCVVTNSDGGLTASHTSANAVLAVAQAPTVTTPADQTVIAGSAVTLTVKASVAATMSAPIFQWQHNGADVPGAISASYKIPAVSPADAGSYTCTVRSQINGFMVATTSGVITLSVVTRPVILAQPTGGTIDPGTSFTLTVSAQADNQIGYQWKQDGVDIPGATSTSYHIAAAATGDSGLYTCVVSNTLNGVSATTTSIGVSLVVKAGPQIVKQPADTSAQETHVATFTIQAVGANLMYQWYRDGVAIAGATSSSYTTPALTLADNGALFSCLVSNGFPSDAPSTQAKLTVTPLAPDFRASVSSLVAGEGVVLTYEFAGTATLQIGSGTPVAVTTYGSTVDYPSASTTYVLSVTNNGMTTPISLDVAVKTYTPNHIYMVVFDTGQLQHFTVDITKLTPPSGKLSSSPTGAGPIHVAASPDEKHLYTSNSMGASISAFSVGTSGALTAVAGSPFAISGDTAPFASAVDPGGQRLYVACAASIKVFTIDAASGALTAAPALDTSLPGRGTGDLLIHPSGRWLYVVDNGGNALRAFAIDANTGALSALGSADSPGNPIGLTFDRAGTRLFTRGSDATPTFNAGLHVFSIDPFTGAVTASSSYAGYGPSTRDHISLPFVRGADQGHHGLTFSKRIDVLYDAYSGDMDDYTSLSSYDVSGGTITGDHLDGLGSPYYVGTWLVSAGDSVFTDRGGSAAILTGSNNWHESNYYKVDATGALRSNAIGDILIMSGGQPVHGVFTGTLK
jgi:hypothetical protein